MTEPADAVFPTCYLCGEQISKDSTADHVPPRQFYGSEIRRKHGPILYTLPTHSKCNRAYQKDEDYFVNSLSAMASGSYSGRSVLKDIQERVGRGKQIPLAHMVLKEFEREPSGLVLPGGKVLKRFDGSRYRRVIWKIVRGLYYREKGAVLPKTSDFRWNVVAPGDKPPELFFALGGSPNRGDYPGVFAYRVRQLPDTAGGWLWALLLWDRIIILVGHHDPSCECDNCRDKNKDHL